MAKKKKPETIIEKPSEELYSVGTWAGMPQYRCCRCAFDTLNLQEMLNHLVGQHDSIGALEELVKAEKDEPQKPAVQQAEASLPEGEEELFEVELKETGSTVDEQGNEHKTFTIKE